MKSEAKVRITIEADHQPHDASVQHTLSQRFTVELNGTDGRQAAEQRTLSALSTLLTIASRQLQQATPGDVSTAKVDSRPRVKASRGVDSHQPSQRGGQIATAAQIRAIHAISRRVGVSLADYMRDRYDGLDVTQLSMRQASQLIDELKADIVSQSA